MDARQNRRVERRYGATAELACVRAREAELGGALAPLPVERDRIDIMALPAPRLERRCLRRTRSALATARQLLLDLRATPTELLKHLPRDAGDVGDPIPHRRPRDTEVTRELSPQARLVQVAGCLRVRVQTATIERRPAPVVGLHQIRH